MDSVGDLLDAKSGIPHDRLLMEFAETVVQQDDERLDELRSRLIEAVGVEGFVDACATIAGFHGFTRAADSTGIESQPMPRGISQS